MLRDARHYTVWLSDIHQPPLGRDVLHTANQFQDDALGRLDYVSGVKDAYRVSPIPRTLYTLSKFVLPFSVFYPASEDVLRVGFVPRASIQSASLLLCFFEPGQGLYSRPTTAIHWPQQSPWARVQCAASPSLEAVSGRQ